MSLPVPVLLIAFRRPTLTARVLDALRTVRPRHLFVALDGPHPLRVGEAELVERTRTLILESVSWPCELELLQQPLHRGCRTGVVMALDWFFAQVAEGIILEDDILPRPCFFRFCAELLERYRDDPGIAGISGVNLRIGPTEEASYRFSRFLPVWGWATWRRAWRRNDAGLVGWERLRRTAWIEDLGGKRFGRKMRGFLDSVMDGSCDTWDYGWFLSCWRHGMVGCLPAVNLVENLGFGSPLASHCQRGHSPLPPPGKLAWPLRHPRTRRIDPRADAVVFERLYAPSPILRAWRRLGR